MNILVTGGAGYIGSHTIIELLAADHTVITIDNLANSNQESLRRVMQITGKEVPFYNIDLRDKAEVEKVFQAHHIDGVIHFAGLKAVGESTQKPLLYYDVNVGGTLALLEIMQTHEVKKLVFSSSATVYGSAPIPYSETSPIGRDVASPYGHTKVMIEEILKDIAHSDSSLEFTALRYFNPIGAHESGLIGENPFGTPNNVMPYITQVAVGKREKLSIFGNDYPTPDGTCIRDYIHVSDLARGHMAALTHSKRGYNAYNLGSGKGTSVLELLHAFEKASGQTIAHEFAPRRAGDIPEFYADASLAATALEWRTEKSLEEACRDSWNWQSKNPNGFGD